MSTVCIDGPRRDSRPRPSPALAFFRRMAALPALWRARIVARTEMQRLDDDVLRDLGLRRDQVEAMRRKPFWRE
jgi:uncharacterized protein YjiS (DUF1127 family)